VLVEYLRHYVKEGQTNWDQWVAFATDVYNTTDHSATGFTPFELFGYPSALSSALKGPPEPQYNYEYDDYACELRSRLQTVHQQAHKNLRLGTHWQLKRCGDKKKVSVNVRTLQLKSCLYWQFLFFQYRMDFTETACVCALLLRIRKDRRKKRHWVHPVVSKRLLNGQFYKLYEDLRNCRGTFFNYFRMSIESFDKLLVLVGPRISYKILDYICLWHHKRDWQ